MSKLDKISEFFGRLGASAKGLAKMALQSRRPFRAPEGVEGPLIVMGNGPSLADTIRDDMDALRRYPAMAVNFAANTPEFQQLKPRYYILADPHFFNPAGDPNVERLWLNLRGADWTLTLLVPAKATVPEMPANVQVARFNPVGVEGFAWVEDWAYSAGRGMPRPRNVLIPAIMCGIRLGYKEIYVVGADHSWMRTLSVDSDNRVVSVQPHFYKDNTSEAERVTSVYSGLRLHQVVQSFYVAFRAYHRIAAHAARHGIHIYNATPVSMIDAFPRRHLPLGQ